MFQGTSPKISRRIQWYKKKILDIQFSICITPEVEPEVTSLTLEIDYLKD